MNTSRTAPTVAAEYFDGLSGRAQPVWVWVEAGRLHWAAAGAAPSQVAASSAVWPERQRHGQRHLQLPDGGVLVFAQAPAYDAWARALGRGVGGVVRWQQSWRLTTLALLLFAACLLALWRWGIPAAADAAVARLPEALEADIGQRTLSYADQKWLKPSQLDVQVQAEVRQHFAFALGAAAAAAGRSMDPPPAFQILFRDGGKLGPNAFALPGGLIVVTDALVRLLQNEPQAVTGVLAHELGHVQHHHGLRQAIRVAALSTVAGLVIGDFSFLLASAPALLAQLDYSRDFERQADAYARDFLRGAGIDPRVMVVFFERAEQEAQRRGAGALPIAFSSHPMNAERTAFFSQH